MSTKQTITVHKIGATIPVSFETLIDCGEMTEEEAREMGWEPTVRPSVSRRRRLRWAMESWWYEHKPHVHLGPCNHDDCM